MTNYFTDSALMEAPLAEGSPMWALTHLQDGVPKQVLRETLGRQNQTSQVHRACLEGTLFAWGLGVPPALAKQHTGLGPRGWPNEAG